MVITMITMITMMITMVITCKLGYTDYMQCMGYTDYMQCIGYTDYMQCIQCMVITMVITVITVITMMVTMVITYEVMAGNGCSREKAPTMGWFSEGTRVCYWLDVIQFNNAQCGDC